MAAEPSSLTSPAAARSLDDHQIDHRSPLSQPLDRLRERSPSATWSLNRYAYPSASLHSTAIAFSGSSYADRTTTPIPGWRLDLLGGVVSLALEGRRHPDVGDHDLRLRPLGFLEQLVVVGRDAHHVEIVLAGEQRPHAFADDEVVVRQQHADSAGGHRVPVPSTES